MLVVHDEHVHGARPPAEQQAERETPRALRRVHHASELLGRLAHRALQGGLAALALAGGSRELAPAGRRGLLAH